MLHELRSRIDRPSVHVRAAARASHSAQLAQVADVVRKGGPEVAHEGVGLAAQQLLHAAKSHVDGEGLGARFGREPRVLKASEAVELLGREHLPDREDGLKMTLKGSSHLLHLAHIARQVHWPQLRRRGGAFIELVSPRAPCLTTQQASTAAYSPPLSRSRPLGLGAAGLAGSASAAAATSSGISLAHLRSATIRRIAAKGEQPFGRQPSILAHRCLLAGVVGKKISAPHVHTVEAASRASHGA
mmetsp:Transcript_3747/g.11664  ORF Transcript_3747/g.11664 Transcript_3747/m.11664 type:complete len:244 (-) Transcript_3747:330-1061(-)